MSAVIRGATDKGQGPSGGDRAKAEAEVEGKLREKLFWIIETPMNFFFFFGFLCY